MNSTKKILLILLPIIIVLAIVITLVVSKTVKTVKKKVNEVENRMEERIKDDSLYLPDKLKKTVYGNKKVTKRNQQIDDFSKVILKGAYKVAFIKSDSTAIIIETDENIHESIIASCVDEILMITEVDNIREVEKLNIYIYYKKLNSIEINGAALITNNDVLVSDELSIELKGAGSIDLEMNVNKLKLDMAGGAHAQLSGKCINSNISMKGFGALSAYKLITDTTKVQIAGAGTARVFASNYLDAKISGAGSIKYMGKPNINKKIAGFGKISAAE